MEAPALEPVADLTKVDDKKGWAGSKRCNVLHPVAAAQAKQAETRQLAHELDVCDPFTCAYLGR